MYPDLSYFFHDLLGTARDNWLSIFKTFGFMLVVAILTAAFLLHRELKRRAAIRQFQPERVKVVENKGLSLVDYLVNGLFGFILGYKGWYAAQNFDALQQNPSDVLLTSEGSWPAGVLVAVLMLAYYYWQDRQIKQTKPKSEIREMYPHDRIGNITTIAAISGVVGAKVFAIIEDIPTFLADPVGTFFSGSGLAIYGGLIGGFVGVFLYLRSHKIPVVPVMDAVAPALIIAYGVGRLGCHFSGDGDWGIVAAAQPGWWFLPDWLWSFDYPHNVIQEGVPIPGCDARYCRQLPQAVYPTSLYETLIAFAIGGILWAVRKPLTFAPGLVFCIYLFLNGVERFWIETIRVNTRYEEFYNLTQAQIIAVAFMVTGAVVGIYLFIRHRNKVKADAGAKQP